METRVDQLRARMAALELDGFLVTDAKNRRYISGFSGSSGALLVTPTAQWIVTDFRYYEQVAQEAPAWTLHKQAMTLIEAVAELLNQVLPKKLGFEADAVTVSEWKKYSEATPAVGWAATEGIVRRLRARKGADEVAQLRRAQSITDAAAARLPRLIQPGQTERQVAWELEKTLRDLGADGPAFEIIVASGPNAALPHYHPGDRVIQENEVVLVDFGARLDGYHSDMTRTYFTGEPTPEYARFYGLVLDALARAEGGIRAGMTARAADALARDFISDHDHGDHFGHGLGHGVGLDIHEMPPVSFRATEDETLAAGQVITIEPGVYLPGWGGIRIEDLAVVTHDGVTILTETPKAADAWRQGRG